MRSGAEKGERTAARLGYRSGYYTRTLVTRVGKLELRVPAATATSQPSVSNAINRVDCHTPDRQTPAQRSDSFP